MVAELETILAVAAGKVGDLRDCAKLRQKSHDEMKVFFIVGFVTRSVLAATSTLVRAREACFTVFILLLRQSTLYVGPSLGIILGGRLMKQPRTRCLQASTRILLSSLTTRLCELGAQFPFIGGSYSAQSAATSYICPHFRQLCYLYLNTCIVDKFYAPCALLLLISFAYGRSQELLLSRLIRQMSAKM